MVGVSWPVEAMPHALREASRIFPSTSAIDGLVRINQMGATLHDVSRDWMSLWILTGVYAALAILATKLFDRAEASHEPLGKVRVGSCFCSHVAIAAGAGLFVYRSQPSAAPETLTYRSGSRNRDSHRPRHNRAAAVGAGFRWPAGPQGRPAGRAEQSRIDRLRLRGRSGRGPGARQPRQRLRRGPQGRDRHSLR